MPPTPGPIPGVLGQIGQDSSNFMMTPRKSTTVTTKGLLNMPGQNNCFLNSAVQVLWHLDAFRRSFRDLSGHSCMAESCIFCALKELFTQFQYSQESALPPDALRHALAKTFCDQRRFQLGFMDDAAECFENILLRIHVHIANQEVDDMCSNVHCIPHQKFAMTLVEQRMCQNCSASSEPLPFTQMVHYITTSALCSKAMDIQKHDPNCTPANSFGRLLRLAGEMGEVRECPSGCGEKIQAKKTLMNHPEVVSIGLVWDSECPTLQHITDVFHSIGMYLQLQDMFHDVYDIKWANQTMHQLVGVVTYYGKHYSTFFFHTKMRVWIYFDDATVQEIGPSWEQVVEKCQRGRFQPLLLLFSNPDSSLGFSNRDTFSNSVYSNDPMNNCPTPANQRQSVINQYLMFQNSKKMANAKSSYGLMRHMDLYSNNIMHNSYSYSSHLGNDATAAAHNYEYKAHYSPDQPTRVHAQTAPVYSNLQYLNSISQQEDHAVTSKLNEVSLPAFHAQVQNHTSRTSTPAADLQSYCGELQGKDKPDFDPANNSDSAYTEEDPEVNDMYISRKAVENVLKQQKRQMSLCRSYSQSSIGNRNSSSSLESFDNVNNSKVVTTKNPILENVINRRDSGSWSSDRNSSSSNNSVENPFLTVVASKRLLLGLNKKNQLPDSNTSDHGYDSFSVSSSDSYPSVNGSPIKLEPRLTQIPEDWQPEDDTDLDQKLKLITEDTSGSPDCDKLCAEADLLLAKSHEKEKDGDLVMAALLSDSAAARARAAMEAPYNNSRSLVSAKMKHSTCVMRSSNLYRRLKDHEMDERRKQKGHHSRQSSRDSTHSRHSRQGSKDSTHSKTGSKDSNPNSDDTENFGKNIEIYGTLPKKGNRKKASAAGPLKTKDDQVYKDFLDKQRKNTNLSNELNETLLKNVDLPKAQLDHSPKKKSQTSSEKVSKSAETTLKSPTRKKDSPPKSESDVRKRLQKQQPHSQGSSPNDRSNGLDFNSRDLLSPIPSPDKKPHKIKRKLMGGFMKRKNRSLPDLREDQASGNPIDCFLDDAIIQVPSMTLSNGKPKKVDHLADGGLGNVSRGFHQPHHAFVKKDLTQRPLLMKVNPPNIQPILTTSKNKLIHALPALKKSSEINSRVDSNQTHIKPSKIPFMPIFQKSEPNLPPLPTFKPMDIKCSPTKLSQKTSAIPVLTPQVSLSPIKATNSPRENFDSHANPIHHPVIEQPSEKEELPLPLNPFLAEIQAKRRQVLNKSLQKQDEISKPLDSVLKSNENKEFSMLPKLAAHGEGTSWLKELQNKQQQFLNKQDSAERSQKPVSIQEKQPVRPSLRVMENVKEKSKPCTMNWKLHSENTSEVASSPNIGMSSNGKTSSSVKDLASKFEKVLMKPKEAVSSSFECDEVDNLPLPPPALLMDPTTLYPVNENLERSSSINPTHGQLRVPSDVNVPSLKSALKVRSDSNRDVTIDSNSLSAKNSVGLPDNSVKPIKSVLKQTLPLSPTALQAPGLPNSANGFLPRPTQPPDYDTAMQRLELIRTSNSDQLEQDIAPPEDETDSAKKKSSKKTVTFSDEVVLVACAEYDEIDFSSNPLFERVYQQHVEAGKGEISILSNSYGNFQQPDASGNRIALEEHRTDNSNISSCNLCHSKQVLPPSSYCTDCEFYLSRFKP